MKSGRLWAAPLFGVAGVVAMFAPIGWKPTHLRWQADLPWNLVAVSLAVGLFVAVVGAPGLLRTWLRWELSLLIVVVVAGLALWLRS